MNINEFLQKFNRSITEIITIKKEDAMKAVESDGYALQYVKDQTESICLKAVERNGDALKYVKDQTESICLKAVESDGYALQYVDVSIFKEEITETTIIKRVF